MGWKLLQKLSIYPQDEETYQLIQRLEKIKGKRPFKRVEGSTANAEEEAKKLENLLEDRSSKWGKAWLKLEYYHCK